MNLYLVCAVVGALGLAIVYFAVLYYGEKDRASVLRQENTLLGAELAQERAEREAMGETIKEQQGHINSLLASLRPHLR